MIQWLYSAFLLDDSSSSPSTTVWFYQSHFRYHCMASNPAEGSRLGGGSYRPRLSHF